MDVCIGVAPTAMSGEPEVSNFSRISWASVSVAGVWNSLGSMLLLMLRSVGVVVDECTTKRQVPDEADDQFACPGFWWQRLPFVGAIIFPPFVVGIECPFMEMLVHEIYHTIPPPLLCWFYYYYYYYYNYNYDYDYYDYYGYDCGL